MILSFSDKINTVDNIKDIEYFERCNKSHFPNIDNATYHSNNLNLALCMPIDYKAKL